MLPRTLALTALARRTVTAARAPRSAVLGHRAMSDDSADADEVLTESSGSLRTMLLNRPHALNALTLDMVTTISGLVKEWEADDTCKVVAMRGAGEKAFCAGGDVVRIAKSGKTDGKMARSFFSEEYKADYLLATQKKPYVAIISGIVMGGGVGVSVHAPFQVATERTLFAMPETAIGLIPDVGGSHFLPRLRGALGMYLALTGNRLKGENVHRAGIATHYVPCSRLTDLEKALSGVEKGTKEEVADILDHYHTPSDHPSSFEEHMEAINDCFDGESMLDIIDRLETHDSEWAKKQLETLSQMSPLSLHITFEQLRRGAELDLADCLKMEYGIVQQILKGNDFYQGVRAKLMKGPPAEWEYKDVRDVPKEKVLEYFQPLEPLSL